MRPSRFRRLVLLVKVRRAVRSPLLYEYLIVGLWLAYLAALLWEWLASRWPSWARP